MSLQDQELRERQVKALEHIRWTLTFIFIALCVIAGSMAAGR